MLFGREVVMWMAVIQAAVALGTSFGLGWTAEQVGAVTAFSAALLGLIARTQVTPIARLQDNGIDPKKLVVVLAMASVGWTTACGGRAPIKVSPERAVALYAGQVADNLRAVRAAAGAAYEAKLPGVTAERYAAFLELYIRVNAEGERLMDATLAYDQAASESERQNAATVVNAVLAAIDTLVPKLDLPGADLVKLATEINALVLKIRGITQPSIPTAAVRGAEFAWVS